MILNIRAIIEQNDEMIWLRLEIQYEIQKFQILGYEFKQKLAKSSTQAYKNDWEIIFITFFKKNVVGNGRYAGKLKIDQFKPTKFVQYFLFKWTFLPFSSYG